MKHYKLIIPLVFLLAIQYFYFEHRLAEQAQQNSLPQHQLTPQPTPQTSVQLPAFSELAKKSRDSVVSIEVANAGSPSGIDGVGSGFVISSDGYLLSNHHVTQGADHLVVKFADGSEFMGELVGSDPETDLSLLKVDRDNLQALQFGSVADTEVGSWVVAIGAPFGLEQSVTAGIVSAKRRSVGEQYIPYIQTDVAINVGNSGGPLITMDGKVIGVNSKIISMDGGSVGLSFAIPIDLASDVVSQLKQNGRVSRGFLGVGYQEVERELAASFASNKNFGALINNVSRNSPAAKGGLKVGDIITAVDGQQIINYTELPFLIGRLRPGMSTELSVIREGEQLELTIVVGSRHPQDIAAIPTFQEIPIADNLLNIRVAEIPQDIRDSLNIEKGVLIDQVESGPAADAGLERGDIILNIQAKPIDNVEAFNSALALLPGQGYIAVLITRPGQGTRYVSIEIE